MTGKTHLAVGTAAALAACRPGTIPTLAICLAAGAVGGLVSDVDVTSSESHRDLAKVLSAAVLGTVLCALIEAVWHPGIAALLKRQTAVWRALPALAAILALCAVGAKTPHRTLMHSIPCLVGMTALVWVLLPAAALPFGAAMASHIAIDLLNRKRVRLLWPLHWGFSLRLCPAEGRVNDLLCLAGWVVTALELAVLIAIHFI